MGMIREKMFKTQIEVKDRELVRLRTLLRKVVEQWDVDGHDPNSELFAQAAKEVGYKQ